MSIEPNVWDIGESIPILLFVQDPNTGFGLTGQSSYLILTIQRDSDAAYWNGVIWTAISSLSFTEVDAINQPGKYLYTLPALANAQADRYEIHVVINNPPIITGENYELHVSKPSSVNVYNAVPV